MVGFIVVPAEKLLGGSSVLRVGIVPWPPWRSKLQEIRDRFKMKFFFLEKAKVFLT